MSRANQCPFPAFEGYTEGVIMPLDPCHLVSTPIPTKNTLMACLELTNAQFLFLKALIMDLWCHWAPLMLLVLQYYQQYPYGMSRAYQCPIFAFEGTTIGVMMQLDPCHVVSTPISTNSRLIAWLELPNGQFLLLKALLKELWCN